MPHRILIVDDDPGVREVLENYLARTLGYEVCSAENGQEGIDRAMEAKFDLAIIDVRMPGLSGPETYTRLKNIYPELESIFFTADKEFENTVDFLRFALPTERVMTKPLEDYSKLTRLIISILGPPAP